ncbi:MAG TPA: hypothetical protein VEI81_01470, partial [Methanoregula sp.]|nr:hypothetical protein [Methanoregula sp.]
TDSKVCCIFGVEVISFFVKSINQEYRFIKKIIMQVTRRYRDVGDATAAGVETRRAAAPKSGIQF